MLAPAPTHALPTAPLQSVPPGGSAGLAVFFLVGLLGGAHCLGMCGPLVTLYADRMGEDRRLAPFEVRQHLLFNLGRTASYATIGAAMGALGALVFDAAAVAAVADPVRGVAGVVVGGFILATGLTYAVRGSVGHGSALPGLDGLFARVSGLLTDRIDDWVRGPRIVGLGMVHGLLPCPILYPAFLYALAQGSPAFGFLSLAVLGLGTVPTLLAYGTAVGSVAPRTRVGLHRALGAAFVLMAVLPLSHGLGLLGVELPVAVPDVPIYQPLR